MGALNKAKGMKPPGGTMNDQEGRQVANLKGVPLTAKGVEPHTRERSVDAEVASHLEVKREGYHYICQSLRRSLMHRCRRPPRTASGRSGWSIPTFWTFSEAQQWQSCKPSN